jgi:hypothetical protein
MARDEHGMPLPGSDLPWRQCGTFEIMSGNEIYVSELGESLGDLDVPFIVHAANSIIPAREIVRRLAEWSKSDSMDDFIPVIRDAEKLLAKMQKGGA